MGGGSTPTVTVPVTNVDPVWSLCPWSATVEVGGQTFEVPPVPALDWLKFLMHSPHPDIMGLISELLPGFEDFFFEQEILLDEMYDLVFEVISTVGARPWWKTLKLMAVARGSWHVLGPKMLTQVDASKVSLAGWLDVLVATIIEHMKPEDVTMFTLQLESPPPGIGVEEDPFAALEMDASAFLAMA